MFIGESGGSHCEETNGFLWDLHIFVGSDDILNDVKDIRYQEQLRRWQLQDS